MQIVPSAFGFRTKRDPRFNILFSHEGFEVREYAPMITANLKMEGSLDEFMSYAYLRLSQFTTRHQIEMTYPVLINRQHDGWEMAFILPDKYGFISAPILDDETIELRAIPSRRVALCRYNGANTKERLSFAIFLLQSRLSEYSQFVAISPVWWAQYYMPYSVPFLKKNEVQVEVTEILPN